MTAYQQGRAAYEQDKPRSENPYPVGSRVHHYWKLGWHKGKTEKDQKVENTGPADKPPD
jgi:hypothetical protein